MSQIVELITALRRPRILVQAARHGVQSYDSKREIMKLTGYNSSTAEALVDCLARRERLLDRERREGSETYDMHQHIQVLTALLAELRPLLRRSTRP